MNQQILKYLKDYSYDTWDVNRLIVSSFLLKNDINEIKNDFIKGYLISIELEEEYSHLQEFIELFSDHPFGIEELIEFFEFVISPVDKEINGAVYTPDFIRNYIVKSALQKKSNADTRSIGEFIFGDIACGCGGFFYTITAFLREKTSKSYFEIFDQNIFGLDIQEYSIIRAKILLCLTAILNKEDEKEFIFNLFCGDALNFDWKAIEKVACRSGFDIVVGNPPYVGVTKMGLETRKLMKNWKVSLTGKPDLYIPFFEIGIENLNQNGVLGYITVNSFFKSLNGRLLRTYFSSNDFSLSIVDFGNEQVFRSRSTYTCICILSKGQETGIHYLKSDSRDLTKIRKSDFTLIRYKDIDDFNGWHLNAKQRTKIISKIESTGIPLGERFIIRNGFATLKNNVFLFKPHRETKKNYAFYENGKEVLIEKEICRDAIKPNTLKTEEELFGKLEKVIFPYLLAQKNDDLFGTAQQKLEILPEDDFKKRFPLAYAYLSKNRKVLATRDRGNKKYEKWYAYGRNQALTLHGYKLLFPYISSKPCFVLTDNKDLLFYNGYAIFSDSIKELKILQRILMSNVFWYYIKHTSKPYSGDFFSIAKNYIKNFSICNLTDIETNELLSFSDTSEVDEFLQKKYDISLNF